jgi:hypothetical protein
MERYPKRHVDSIFAFWDLPALQTRCVTQRLRLLPNAALPVYGL